ncbi:MAG: type I DNA topoisomerase, partial [Victivallales bacterium]|nr:type I DNA topoisomerase [Victivallales bacterium]
MSNKKLVIVESPAKARTIKRILGDEFEVTASVGHIRDLPEKNLGIDIAQGFEPQYVVTQPKVVASLKAVAKNADEIYLAPDPDREGEAIAWHLKEILDSKKSKKTFHRVVFHEITKSAVSKAFEEPSEVNLDLVDAQQARRVLDRLVGYQVSPLLWSKVRRGVSAGRVQSVALRIVCEREREIIAFNPEEYWVFEGMFEPAATPGEQNRFQAKLTRVAGKKTSIHTAEEAERIMKALADSDSFSVTSVEVKPQKKSAPPPFITSTLQQSAGNLLRMGASQTMSLAQQLYEGIDGSGASGGLITYMRTDSVAVAGEAQKACRDFVQSEYGAEYVPEKARNFKSSASAQGAHEAIRPTDVTLTPKQAARFLDSNQLRLYSLIWKRFVASQMSPAIMEKTTVDVENSGGGESCVFQATAIVTKFKGYTVLTPPKEDKDADAAATSTLSPEIVLGLLSKGDVCLPIDLTKEQKFTEPPPRFSEATL